MFRPKGFYAGSNYIGYLPNGETMKFPTEQEYLEYLGNQDEAA